MNSLFDPEFAVFCAARPKYPENQKLHRLICAVFDFLQKFSKTAQFNFVQFFVFYRIFQKLHKSTLCSFYIFIFFFQNCTN
ncbi:hypothetical protein EGI32_07485 [Ferruginibacter sp. HRS2-29]|nr:hypothetical protein [Ferruginibacter sp. HRS2-29]